MDFYNLMNIACHKEGLTFERDKYDKFIIYKDMIKEWNEKVNLTAITEDEEIIKKHFIDSIKSYRFEPLNNCRNLIDIGTGAGFPGIPLKIMRPDLEVVLLDSLNKRVNFLNEVINRLGLIGIKAIHGRAEDFARENNYRENFDVAISRAVANMSVLSELCIPFVKNGGYFVAMKGPSVDEEINEGKKAVEILGGSIENIIEVDIEDTDLKHNLVIVKKVKATPKVYPRKAGTAAKKPIK
ncbi:16S rRNA (guanine(527)-N(7))-methyltransferase RsmG [Clostridium omnivorum]|uniref:Ribosomal RNA small subunit methyltransferase G n=1 Tax=Clostridium omnivorum TaxID=1604902 RepID=A0ABQ5N5F3_9CLOT|nr:16S rRNA (guanine(527)-N(7))-methyltransferase RsmG [Clostridium sp. E14]GLC30462.1 ribosomal RNA small subunit methyltransferase G [Clostridium sp. E14]